MQTASSSKNPLVQLFGIVLRQLRARAAGITSDEVAGFLPISSSAYRLVESGGAILQPAYAGELLKAFQTLAWPRVIAYLVCAQASVPAHGEPVRGVWEAAGTVANLDPALDRLINVDLRPLWAERPAHLDESDPKMKPCVEAVRRYLEGEAPPSEIAARTSNSLKDWAAQAPDSISPIHLDLLLQELEVLQCFPANVPPAQFKMWEDRNFTEFADVYAFVTDLNQIVKNAGHFRFNWLYLELTDFGHVHILCANPEPIAKSREALIRNIARLRLSPSPKDRLQKRELTKLIFTKSLNQTARQTMRDLLCYDPDHGRLLGEGETAPRRVQLDNVWLYRLNLKRNNITVGFADNYQGQDDFTAVTLSKGEVATLLPKLKNGWD